MPLWTKLQREYVKDIERNLGITYDGKPTRTDASKFIAENAESNRKIRDLLRKQAKPTGRQLRFIKDIEEVLEVKFIGTTLKQASEFIQKYITEYSAQQTAKQKIKRYYNKFADNIDAYQRMRRQAKQV